MKIYSYYWSHTSFDVHIAAGLFTADFRNNGKLYISYNDDNPPTYDTLDWHFHNDSVLVMGGDQYLIDTFIDGHLITTDYYFDNTDSVKHVLEFKK